MQIEGSHMPTTRRGELDDPSVLLPFPLLFHIVNAGHDGMKVASVYGCLLRCTWHHSCEAQRIRRSDRKAITLSGRVTAIAPLSFVCALITCNSLLFFHECTDWNSTTGTGWLVTALCPWPLLRHHQISCGILI